MVKGVSRRVIVVDSPDPRIFEQAIFILPTDGGGVSSRQLVDQAVPAIMPAARAAHAAVPAGPRGCGPCAARRPAALRGCSSPCFEVGFMRENGPLEIDGFPSFSYRFFSSLGADANASALFFAKL